MMVSTASNDIAAGIGPDRERKVACEGDSRLGSRDKPGLAALC
jgi:hypothetical protein